MVRTHRIILSCILFILLFSLLVNGAPDTPLPDGEAAIRQAHITLAAYTREVEMNAAINYISPLVGTDSSRLQALLSEYRKQESLIPTTKTAGSFMNITREMRKITAEFHNETALQLAKGNGKEYDLTLKIRESTTGNPYIEEKRQAYWNTRKTRQLAEFDTYVNQGQASLDALKAAGYTTAAAQRTLDVLASKRPDLAAALDAKSEERVSSAAAVIVPLSQDLGRQVAESQDQISDADRMAFLIDEGYRAVSRADAANAELTKTLLDIGPLEPETRQLKIDLASAKRTLATGNLAAAKTPMILVRKDFKDLSTSYREVANSADLPSDFSTSLRALSLTLDSTADQMDGA